MLLKRLFFLLLIFGAVSTPTFALDCANIISSVDFNRCGQLELDKSDVELNRVYKSVLNSFDKIIKNKTNISDKSKLKQSLIESQRFWLKYRDADCSTIYIFWLDGTIRNQMYLGCMLSKTEQRIKELKLYNEAG